MAGPSTARMARCSRATGTSALTSPGCSARIHEGPGPPDHRRTHQWAAALAAEHRAQLEDPVQPAAWFQGGAIARGRYSCGDPLLAYQS